MLRQLNTGIPITAQQQKRDLCYIQGSRAEDMEENVLSSVGPRNFCWHHYEQSSYFQKAVFIFKLWDILILQTPFFFFLSIYEQGTTAFFDVQYDFWNDKNVIFNFSH